MVDCVERGRQIGVQNPHPLSTRPFERGKQGTDGVGTTTTRAKPVGTRVEPGLPLGLQRVADPRLMTPIHEHWNSYWTLVAMALGNVHAPNRQWVPGAALAVHPHRHLGAFL